MSEIRVGTTYTGPTDGGWQRGAIINHYSSQCWGACNGTDNNGTLKQQDHWIPDSSGGVLSVRDANQYLKLNLPEDGGYTTIAGFLMDHAGRVLQRGDKVAHEGYVFEVERVQKRRISRIRLIPGPQTEEEHAASPPSLLGPLFW